MGCRSFHKEDTVVPPQGQERVPRGLMSRFFTLLVKGYQYCISPLFPPSCRYIPTCSQYALEAIAKYGALKGLCKAVRRVLRCHPFARGGYDPVK